ncbi:MAG: metallophosphoesterase [Verrucomicrobia bacterium]|nr:metallophosphoesterase [Verrucomicrobiota bacterium]
MVLQSLRVLFALLLSCGTALATAREHGAFYFIGIGCLPYSRVAQIEQQLARLTEAVNAANPSFIVHMGDINGGDEPASDARFTYIKNWFNSFEAPLIYTPGDNEWTDAHRPAIGGYDPLERLARIRSYFFPRKKLWSQFYSTGDSTHAIGLRSFC